jgi:hypothetical protein
MHKLQKIPALGSQGDSSFPSHSNGRKTKDFSLSSALGTLVSGLEAAVALGQAEELQRQSHGTSDLGCQMKDLAEEILKVIRRGLWGGFLPTTGVHHPRTKWDEIGNSEGICRDSHMLTIAFPYHRRSS